MQSSTEHFRRLRAQQAGDPQRPRYHFSPPANWMNDPNGIIEWQGKFHLFYQHNPEAPIWDNMHWGHAVSEDLVHWADLPIALAPGSGDPDADGCWSGCAVNNDGRPTILYTGVKGDWAAPQNQRVCLATSLDGLNTWQKYAGNPIIARPPDGLDVNGFRDPFVWREADQWYMAIGAGIRDIGGAVLLYRSVDLLRWQYLHPLCIGDMRDASDPWTGSLWEVPQLHQLGDAHILFATVWDGDPLYSVYFTGRYHNHRFTIESVQKLDYGDRHFYAAHIIVDSQGRHLLWGFIGEGRSVAAQKAAGWSGVMSLPRVLSLRADGKLAQRPAPEIESLRRERHRCANIDLPGDSADLVLDARGDALEIVAEFDAGAADEIGVKVRCSPDSEEETTIFYRASRKQLGIDRRRSRRRPAPEFSTDVQRGDFELGPGENLHLRIFVDCSVIEVFANDRFCITSRVYPSRADSLGVAVSALGQARIVSLDIWTLAAIW